MPRRTTRLLVTLVLCLLSPPVSRAQELVVTPDSAQGIYQPGQTIRWKIQVSGADVTKAAFTLKTGGLTKLADDNCFPNGASDAWHSDQDQKPAVYPFPGFAIRATLARGVHFPQYASKDPR